jgi:DNA-binding response OmpR family regulator
MGHVLVWEDWACGPRGLEFGTDLCLSKPFRFSDLLFRLESFAHHQRAA